MSTCSNSISPEAFVDDFYSSPTGEWCEASREKFQWKIVVRPRERDALEEGGTAGRNRRERRRCHRRGRHCDRRSSREPPRAGLKSAIPGET
ncbi:hypothetical protein LXL04_012480 [Taraxacum kok-saghyz]